MHKDIFPHLRESCPRPFTNSEVREIQCHEGWSDLLNGLLGTLHNHQDSAW